MTERLAPVLMVQGTASHAGKSTLVTALCRILKQDGYRVAPFKAQNMALNSFVAAEGGEIGRSQALQAEACGLDPSIDMNPILLKPEADAHSQVIVNGQSIGSMPAAVYQRRKLELWPHVTAALDRLRARYDVVVAEGAGSPAEINLKATDLANMRVARYARAPVLLVGDIDRGGVFASLLGTLELLDPDERALVAGFAINKFRGDPAILAPGLDFLTQRTGVPVLGVVPHLPRLDLPEEDSLGLDDAASTADPSGRIDIAVIRLPHIANFDEFAPLAGEPLVRLRYVEQLADLGQPNLVILPGTKTTVADLDWLRRTGLADGVLGLAQRRTPILGICGGYQMLGSAIHDPDHAESGMDSVPGLGLLPVETTFATTKRTVRVHGRLLGSVGPFGEAAGADVVAYEIHMGRSVAGAALQPLVRIDTRSGESVRELDGLVSGDGLIAGTYLHGLFENDALRHGIVDGLAAQAPARQSGRAEDRPRRNLAAERGRELDRLADAVRASLDLRPLLAASGLG
ncbi:MAG: cobyric acid synthase [Chloroflexi bacterium]|nr:cobyric acid synthase [Chloroflexota bacterium]